LAGEGIPLGIARARGLFRMMLERIGIAEKLEVKIFFRLCTLARNA